MSNCIGITYKVREYVHFTSIDSADTKGKEVFLEESICDEIRDRKFLGFFLPREFNEWVSEKDILLTRKPIKILEAYYLPCSSSVHHYKTEDPDPTTGLSKLNEGWYILKEKTFKGAGTEKDPIQNIMFKLENGESYGYRHFDKYVLHYRFKSDKKVG